MTGTERVGALKGSADIRSGKALIRLEGGLKGADRFAILLDAEPDRNRFDVDARVTAPADGLLPAMLGRRLPIDLKIDGDGRLEQVARQGDGGSVGQTQSVACLAADAGRYRLNGKAATGQIFKGKMLRLTSPLVDIKGDSNAQEPLARWRIAAWLVRVAGSREGRNRLGANRYRNLRLAPTCSGRRPCSVT